MSRSLPPADTIVTMQYGSAEDATQIPITEAPNEGVLPTRHRSYVGSLEFWIQLILITVVASLLTLQQIQFRGTWAKACDYNIKVWSTVNLSWFAIFYVGRFVYNVFIRHSSQEDSATIWCFLIILRVAKFAWLLYGIKPVFVEVRCDPTSSWWGIVLWWFDFITTIVPLCCFICILSCFACLSAAGASTQPVNASVSPELRNKLVCEKYGDVKDELGKIKSRDEPRVDAIPSGRLEGNEEERVTMNSPQTHESTGGGAALQQHLSDIAATLSAVPLPDMSQHLRRLQSGTTAPTIVGKSVNESACPICFCNFELNDYVILMPCDSRHIFHRDCLFAWFDNSQRCPVCRRSVVESLEAKDPPA